jgi:hypothetical protein
MDTKQTFKSDVVHSAKFVNFSYTNTKHTISYIAGPTQKIYIPNEQVPE